MTKLTQASSSRMHQQGAALLMAMVIVTLVATISASMVWQQWRAVQVESAERQRAQILWVLSGALDYPKLILREDGRNPGPDHLGELWATPLAETNLASFLAFDKDNNANDGDLPLAYMSGKVNDAMAKYNLSRLVGQDFKIIEEERLVLGRLCEFASLAPSMADRIAQAMRLAILAQHPDNPEALAELGGEQGRARAPLMPQTVDQLLWLGVLDAGTLERLRPYVTLLPREAMDAHVNVNTAPKEVIAAVVSGLDLARAARIVQARQRKPFKSIEELTTVLGQKSPPWEFGRLDTKSEYFEINGRVRLEDSILEQRNLVQRNSSNEVKVLQQSRFSGLDLANGGASTP